MHPLWGILLSLTIFYSGAVWAKGSVARAALLFLSRFKHRPVYQAFYGDVFPSVAQLPRGELALRSATEAALGRMTDDAVVGLVYGYEQARFLDHPMVEGRLLRRGNLHTVNGDLPHHYVEAFGREFGHFKRALETAARREDLGSTFIEEISRGLPDRTRVLHARRRDDNVYVLRSVRRSHSLEGRFKRSLGVPPLMGFHQGGRIVAFGRQNIIGKNFAYSVADRGQTLLFRDVSSKVRVEQKVRSFGVVWRFRYVDGGRTMPQLGDLILQLPIGGRIIRLVEAPDGNTLIGVVQIRNEGRLGLSWAWRQRNGIERSYDLALVKWDIRPETMPATKGEAPERITDIALHAERIGLRTENPFGEFYKSAVPMDTWTQIDNAGDGIIDLSFSPKGDRILMDSLGKDGATWRNYFDPRNLRALEVGQ